MLGLRTRRGRVGLVASASAVVALAVGAVGATAHGGSVTHRSDGKTIVFWHYLTDREALLQQMSKTSDNAEFLANLNRSLA